MASIQVLHGDCLALLPTLAEASVDACVTDPPYGLEFMGKEWDGADGFRRSLNGADVGRDNAFGRMSARGPEYRTAGTGRKGKPGIGERDTEWVSNQGWNQFRCAACGHLFHGGSPCECDDPKPVRADNRWHLFQSWCEAWARECLRVLKPGGHLVAFGGARTYHRLACAIEDAGFEIRDQIMWIYGSGFPKSLDVSKAIDKAAGAEREVVGYRAKSNNSVTSRQHKGEDENGKTIDGRDAELARKYQARGGFDLTRASTDAARKWQGFGTALKPAHEPIVLARKPLIGTVAQNVMKWGTGALNISACRVQPDASRTNPHGNSFCTCPWPTVGQSARNEDMNNLVSPGIEHAGQNGLQTNAGGCATGHQLPEGSQDGYRLFDRLGGEPVHAAPVGAPEAFPQSLDAGTSRDRCAKCGRIRVDLSKAYSTIPDIHEPGRWPANVIHDGSDEVVGAFPESNDGVAVQRNGGGQKIGGNGIYGGSEGLTRPDQGYGSSGSAARFFYSPKADKGDRLASKHPTVKPVDLMAYLCRLVTPPGGLVLDPFAGSGSTGMACMREGFRAILIEREAEYVADIRRRIAHVSGEDMPLFTRTAACPPR